MDIIEQWNKIMGVKTRKDIDSRKQALNVMLKSEGVADDMARMVIDASMILGIELYSMRRCEEMKREILLKGKWKG